MDCYSLTSQALQLKASLDQSLRPGRVVTDNLAAMVRAMTKTIVELSREQDEELRLAHLEIQILREDLHRLRHGNVTQLHSRPRLVLVSSNDDDNGGSAA